MSWGDSDEDDEQSDFGLDEPEQEDTSEQSELEANEPEEDDKEERVERVIARKKFYCPNCDEEVVSDARCCDNCMTEFERDDA